MTPPRATDVTPVTFEVLGVDAVANVIPEWDACVAMADNGFHQSPWFTTMIWNLDVSRRGEICLVTGRDGEGSLQTVLPLWLSRSRLPLLGLRTLQPLCLHGQETSSIVVGAADRSAATTRVADFLLGPASADYDVLHFATIDSGSLLFAALVDTAHRRALPVRIGPPTTKSVIHPARGSEAVVPGPSRRFRRNIKRAWRVARESGSEVVCRDISWEWDDHKDAIAHLYRSRCGEPSVSSAPALHDEGIQSLLGAMFHRLDRHFRAHAFGAFVDGQLAAYVICFRGAGEVVLWNACSDERSRGLSVGMLLWDHCLHDVAGWPGVERITFAKGNERYKRDWSDAQRSVCELAIVCATGLRRRRALSRWTADQSGDD